MSRPRVTSVALVVVGLAAAVLLVASTGAVVLDGPSDPIGDDVALQPGDNPYTYLDENDELVVDVTEDNPNIEADGVNPNAFTAQRALFYITFDGDTRAEAWIEHDAEAVTFTVDGEPVESREDAARLTPADDAVAVGVEVDTRIVDAVPGDRLIDSISVHAEVAEEPPADEPADASGSPPFVTTEEPAPDVRELELLSVVGGGDTDLDLAGMHVGDDRIRLDRLSFVRDAPGDVEMRVAGTDERPGETAALPPGVDALGYYTVSFAEPDQPIREATAELVVDRDRLDEAGIDPDALVVYHDAGDGWEPTDTTVTASDGSTVRLEAASDGFSAFALATESPALEPVDATLEPSEVAPGESLSVDVAVENVGAAAADDADLRLRTVDGGATVADGAFTTDVGAGETTTTSLTVSLDEPGVHDLIVEGERVTDPATVGTVVVTSADDPGDGSEPGGEAGVGDDETGTGDGAGAGDGSAPGAGPGDADEPTDEPAGFELADLAGVVALFAIVFATLFLVRRAPR